MNLKKLSAIVLALVLIVMTLTACGGENATSGDLIPNEKVESELTNMVAVVKAVGEEGKFTVEFYTGDVDKLDDFSAIDMSAFTASGEDQELALDENVVVAYCDNDEWYATSYEKIAQGDALVISYEADGSIASIIIPTKK